jgi:hypothetical protein
MDDWLIRKPRSTAISKENAPNPSKEELAFRFKDTLYNAHSTGHQRRSGGAVPSSSWMQKREQKIQAQFPEHCSNIFNGVNIYINGN